MEKPNEEWRQIAGCEGSYEASSLGNVRSLPRIDSRGNRSSGKILRPFRDGNKGYVAVDLHNKRTKLHRIIAQTFIANPENKGQVNHKNGNPADNRAENLEWVTGQENIRHSYDVLGKKSSGGHLGKIGAAHHCSKRVIGRCLENGVERVFPSATEAARELGISSGSVPRCCSGKYKSSKGWSFRYEGE